MTIVAFYDTKPYDREYMLAATGASDLRWVFHEFRLAAETASTVDAATAVCGFVNDRLDRDCLAALAAAGVRHVALRCAGFNNVDLAAARDARLAIDVRELVVRARRAHAGRDANSVGITAHVADA